MTRDRLYTVVASLVYTAAAIVLLLDMFVWRPN